MNGICGTEFSRPFGTDSIPNAVPAVNCRAILGCPYGTKPENVQTPRQRPGRNRTLGRCRCNAQVVGFAPVTGWAGGGSVAGGWSLRLGRNRTLGRCRCNAQVVGFAPVTGWAGGGSVAGELSQDVTRVNHDGQGCRDALGRELKACNLRRFGSVCCLVR
jgi:hypothetical protein